MSDSRMSTYKPLPINLVKGKGPFLWDANGKQYFDAICGIAVCGLGHTPDEITKAICDQAATLVHCSNLFEIGLQRQLADKLVALSGMENVFFSNSGAEANECAIKIARKFAHDRKIKNPSIIVTEGAFHGRTLATLTATGNRKIQAGFEPLVQGFVRARYGDLDAIRTIAATTTGIVAILVEPIQGEGGILIPPDDYLDGLRAICDQQGWLLMLDEIQTGLCRTGKWFAFQHSNMRPDVITLAKSLGNGMPIGACLARGEAAQVFKPGNHGSTFGGNPLACRTALAVLEKMEREKLMQRAAVLGERLLQGLRVSLKEQPGIVAIRGKGLMIGIELDRPCVALAKQAADAGLLINITADNTIRLLPPLILSDQQADQLVDLLTPLVVAFLASAREPA